MLVYISIPILKDLHSLDQEFIFLNYVLDTEKTYKMMKLKVIIALVVIILVLIVHVILKEITFRSLHTSIVTEISICTLFSLPLICTTFMLLQFCTILIIIKQRHNLLNKKIEYLAALCNKHKSNQLIK